MNNKKKYYKILIFLKKYSQQLKEQILDLEDLPPTGTAANLTSQPGEDVKLCTHRRR
jgi:hypothetical protein